MMNQRSNYQQMRLALSQWVELTDAQWEQLSSIFAPRHIQPQEHLHFPGDQNHQFLFVTSGLLRFYYLTSDGREFNKAFVAEEMFAGALAAFALNAPMLYGVEALESTEVLCARCDDFFELYDQDPVFDRLGRKIAEWVLMQKEQRMRSLLHQQASARYQEFADQHRDLLERVPQYHIASYLGITEVSLSRLKGTIQDDANPIDENPLRELAI